MTITVIPYCRKTLYKNSSIADFLYRAGLLDIKFLYASDEIQVNESLTIEYIEVKKIINKRPRSKTRERVIIRCLENLSKSSTKGTRYELALSVQRDIEAYVEKDNETLNRRYGSREFKFLARAQSGNTVCVGVSNKDVEQALKSFEREYRRPYYVMLWIIYAASALLRRHAKPVHAVIHQLKMFLHNLRFKNS